MTSVILKYFQNGINNLHRERWSCGDLAYSVLSSYETVKSTATILENNKTLKTHLPSLCLSSWRIFKTALRAHRLVPTTSLLSTMAVKCAAAAWIGLNAWTLIDNNTPVEEGPDHQAPILNIASLKFLWKATPYLLLITSIGLTILEARKNPSKALISAAVMAITTLDHYYPSDLSWFWNRCLPPMMSVAACYYTNSWFVRAEISLPLIASLIKK